jgi:hypothetical protein
MNHMAAVITDLDVEECLIAAANLALFFTGMPDEEVLDAMPRLRSHMEAGISERFGADLAGLIAAELVKAVLRCRHEIEAARGPMSPAVN